VAGTIVSSPAGIQCGTSCFATYSAAATVTLTATPADGSTFAGWSGGGLRRHGPSTVNGSGLTSVTAMFTPSTQPSDVIEARAAVE
jgi:Divergent InlB B-repeat domain